MVTSELDETDRGILHLLQQGARMTPVDIAKQLPVSDGTVRNRIEKMEEQGIIEGYVPIIDYEEAGFPLRIVFSCTAPIDERAEMAKQALKVPNVVHIREMLDAQENVQVLTVATETDEITQSGSSLVDLGFEIVNERFMRTEYHQPFNHFGQDIVEDEGGEG